MSVELTKAEIEEARRLGKCLDSEMIPVGDIRNFLKRIQQKGESNPAGSQRKKRNDRRIERKEKYRMTLRT